MKQAWLVLFANLLIGVVVLLAVSFVLGDSGYKRGIQVIVGGGMVASLVVSGIILLRRKPKSADNMHTHL